VVVLPGFQGVNQFDDITTLGRGGSDTTAVALSAVMNAEVCEIYTDVDGVYTADPRIVKEAKKWDKISYDEMLELASLGAQVMHPRSIELAKKYQVPLVVKHSSKYIEGTIITEVENVEKVLVRGVTKDTDIVKVSIMEVPDMPGIAYHLFDLLAEQKITVDTIIQAVSRENINDISFTVHNRDFDATIEACNKYVKTIETGTVVVDTNVVKLSIVGIGMAGGYKVASTFFKALYESGINIQMISTSEIKISCIIEDKGVNQAIKLIHEYFQLGEVVNVNSE
jgi:aspartate kinase